MSVKRTVTDPGFLWGHLYEPVSSGSNRRQGLRTVIFGSTTAGNLVISDLSRLELHHPDLINLVAVATDDPLDPHTQISVAKRIWSKYTEQEMERLRDLVIDSSMKAGVPCYTGSVKTEAFRSLFRRWDPDVVIMCCFGQRIDQPLFHYPPFGMYNFHPSDLAANIGAGPKPFEVTISQGRTTSRMIVHQVNEIIDGGPIVGSSPPVNICLADGRYPESLLTLQEKIPSVCGWMAVELIRILHDRKQKGLKGAIPFIDFEAVTPLSVKRLLMEPALNDPGVLYTLPDHPLLNHNA